MILKRLFAALLACTLIFGAGLADAALDEYISLYNEYRDDTGAVELSSGMFAMEDGIWYADISSTVTLGLMLDEDSNAYYIALQCGVNDSEAEKILINCWYISDADLTLDEIGAFISSLRTGGSSNALMYKGWYAAYEYVDAKTSETGTPYEVIGLVWYGEAAASATEPGATPAPTVKPAKTSDPGIHWI